MNVFHITEQKHLPRIYKKGLQQTGGDFGRGVYVWIDKRDAILQARSGEGWAFNLTDPVVLTLSVTSRPWLPKISDVLYTLELDDEADLDLDDEDYYMAMGVVRRAVKPSQIVKVEDLSGQVVRLLKPDAAAEILAEGNNK